MTALQWGGRFAAPPDPTLLKFGSSLQEDLVLAPFDVQCSLAHVVALRGGGIINAALAAELSGALHQVAEEIAKGAFQQFAQAYDAEDVHGAIDTRVRELAPASGEWLHAGRSRNDQVATTLLLYAQDRSRSFQTLALTAAAALSRMASEEVAAGTLLAGTTHWQPAQPVSLAFWLQAAAEPFVRDAKRFQDVAHAAKQSCPLGSAALAGSTLPLDRAASRQHLAFETSSRNAMDAIGNRDIALDLAHAAVRSMVNASRICEELVLWSTPAFGYVRLGDAASTGSSLMPQKRNPDPFELVRATANELTGRFAGALASVAGIALSYHRDLQITKRAVLEIVETASAAFTAFALALGHIAFDRERMNASADAHFTVATDVADALIAAGVNARKAHASVGNAVRNAEAQLRGLQDADLQALARRHGLSTLAAPLDAKNSVRAKRSYGSTHPDEVKNALAALNVEIAQLMP